jgi:hypothetical protein
MPQTQPARPDYEELFKHPILPPDPPAKLDRPSFLYRTRNSLWWIVVFVVFSVTALAFMDGNYVVDYEPGCGDDFFGSLFG